MSCVFQRILPVLSLTVGILFPARADSALVIDLDPANGMSQLAIDGFQVAADYWQSVLMDDVRVNIDIDFTTLGAGILGQAGSTTQQVNVDDYFAALNGDATSMDDATALANLPALTNGFYLEYRTQVNTEGGSTVVSIDDDQSGNNFALDMNTATIKALGLYMGSPVAADADITFSDQFTWDFDPSDGIDGGAFDFVGVAIHEIGHALGFVSGVDTVDFAILDQIDLENFRVFSGLDMFRYSANDGVLDLSAGTNSYFSIDGGQTNLGLFSTGSFFGDGFQASHWKDNLGLGIMDPTLSSSVVAQPTELDLRAFDVIGWDRVFTSEPIPEPSGIVLLGIGGLSFCFARVRRKKTRNSVTPA